MDLQKSARTYNEIEEFLVRNKEEIKQYYGEDFESHMADVKSSFKLTKQGTVEDLQVDSAEGDDKDCAYVILRNPTSKRIVVTFRGTVKTEDWLHNIKMVTETWNAEDFLKQEVDEINATVRTKVGGKKVTLQKGWHQYLFESKRTGKRNTTHDLILQKLNELMSKEENKGYGIYVTGHSLGGALATLHAFTLATSDEFLTPIKLITFASPQPGHLDFAEAIEKLVDMGRMYHCRVTNNNDVVPQLGIVSFIWSLLPFVKLRFKAGFRHSGYHLNLFSDQASTFKQTIAETSSFYANDMTFFRGLLNIKKNHSLDEYLERFEKDGGKDLLTEKKWEELTQIIKNEK